MDNKIFYIAGKKGCFNPTIVRLKPIIIVTSLNKYPAFQSYHSSIKTHTVISARIILFPFQSYHSSIKTSRSEGCAGQRVSFNPTIVRLKLEWALLHDIEITFQSYHSSIKTGLLDTLFKTILCFNPTIVRLKQIVDIKAEFGIYVSILP